MLNPLENKCFSNKLEKSFKTCTQNIEISQAVDNLGCKVFSKNQDTSNARIGTSVKIIMTYFILGFVRIVLIALGY